MSETYPRFILRQAAESPSVRRFLELDFEPGDFVEFRHLEGSARALTLAEIQNRLGRPVLVVAPDPETAERWYDDLRHFEHPGAQHFPMTETLPYENEEPVREIVARRYAALHALGRGENAESLKPPAEGAAPAPPFVVAPVEALRDRVPARATFDALVMTFQWGERFEIEEVARRLVDLGYDRQTMVEGPGEFAVRGHIVDVFTPQLDNPVRFDLFGDDIESMRFFETATQRSVRDGAELERVTILPAEVHSVVDRLLAAGETLVPLADWLAEETILVLDAPEKFDAALEQMDRLSAKRFEELTVAGKAPETPERNAPEDDLRALRFLEETPPPQALYLDADEIRRALNPFASILLPQIASERAVAAAASASLDFGVNSYETIKPDVEAYLKTIRQKQAQDFSIHVVCDNDGQVMRLTELLAEHEITSRAVLPDAEEWRDFLPRTPLEGYQEVVLTVGPMHTGFIFPESRLLIVTDREMFGRYKRRHTYRKAYKGRPIASASEIRRGDYVVHEDNGVGRFTGVRREEIDGRLAELLEIEYAEGAKLLVPIDKVHHVQKYAGTDGATPTLDRLGSKRWRARKKKSQEKIEEMAEELLQLYAQRAAAEGYAYGEDTVWMREFEESFVYQETPDQLSAIEQTKRDMMRDKPMDRLLCGDVGFGKTEVAMRAAFKAVQDKKQVAVLAPTTILAQQHFTTFKERFADYPVRIEVASRFRTAMETREVLKAVKRGEVDVLIGTHRLLSKDVEFFDVGLLIVDEEQRFGVRQKERIKELRAQVDILSLSATPIPRTLHMALSGLRDMSTINTPPRDRLPVRTRVIRFVPEEIEEAIMRERNRGGQVYFVHNRVQSIHAVQQRLQEIVPDVRIAVAHGQMPERELEKVMFDFIDRKYDVLLSTTIIESGLDIPNVNTIVVNRADAFGLAQLYQLRGRVGRDVRRAYAYLIIPDGRPITDTAVKRLRAIEEFTDLGMGFQIAMRDLEIRGAGNLLGAQQHGAIEAVGFDLYCQMLEEAVQRLQGKRPMLDQPIEIRWPLPTFLPPEYVPVESQRIAFYKRCSSARDVRELVELAEELRDRYGEIPPEARNLIAVSRMRVLARRAGIDRIAAGPKGLRLHPRDDVFEVLRRALPLKDEMKSVRDVGADDKGAILFQFKTWRLDRDVGKAIEVLEALAPGRAGAA